MNEEWWQCFNYDVCLYEGEWHLCDPFGNTISKFPSPERAMDYADRMLN